MHIRLFVFVAVSGLLTLPGSASMPTNLALAGEVKVIRLQDSTGQYQQMICRPAEPGEIAPAPARSTPLTSPPAAPLRVAHPSASPTVPAPGRAVAPLPASPATGVGSTALQGNLPLNPQGNASIMSREIQTGKRPCPPPLPPSLAPTWQIYADPTAVAAAWECYSSRPMAYESRPWRGQDPAVHSPLPPLQSPPSPARTRRSSKSAPAKAETVTATAKNSPSPTVSATGGATMPAMPAPRVGNTAPPAATNTTDTSGRTTPPVKTNTQTSPGAIAPAPESTTPSSQASTSGSMSGQISGQTSSQTTKNSTKTETATRPESLLEAAPRVPNQSPRPSGVYSEATPSVREF